MQPPLVEEESEGQNHEDANGLLRREVVTPPDVQLRAQDDPERGATKTFPMWLGETTKKTDPRGYCGRPWVVFSLLGTTFQERGIARRGLGMSAAMKNGFQTTDKIMTASFD